MQIFGFEITRKEKNFTQVTADRGGWLPIIRESFAGAFQQNVTIKRDTVLTHHAVFSCMTLIASDISKLRVKLYRAENDMVRQEIFNQRILDLLNRPNSYQNRIQFWETWFLSKLSNGNTYVLKQRDSSGTIIGLFILDPNRVQVLVTEQGDVFYHLYTDSISAIEADIIVPAREIIHDRYNTLFHPLVGLSPIIAAGLAATQGVNIQNDLTNFFKNRSIPSGILSSDGSITKETADRVKAQWESGYSGENAGKVAVVGDGLKFSPMHVTANDAQVVEQLRWTTEVICSIYHVPPYKVGLGVTPAYNNVQALNTEYYSQALQILIEAAESLLDEGLELPSKVYTQFDLEGLFRMDTKTQVESIRTAVQSGIMSPNEGRKRMNLPPAVGGDTPYMQQQNFSLEALNDRDKTNPLGVTEPPDPEPAEEQPAEEQDNVRSFADAIVRKSRERISK